MIKQGEVCIPVKNIFEYLSRVITLNHGQKMLFGSIWFTKYVQDLRKWDLQRDQC